MPHARPLPVFLLLFACLALVASLARPLPAACAEPLKTLGHVTASASVPIIPRVDGQLVEMKVMEGEHVDEGQFLFRVDPRPYEAHLAEMRAMLAKAKALLKKGLHDQRRFDTLVRQGYVSQEAFEATTTNTAVLETGVASAQAAVNSAALQLSYCTLTAPISGRIGQIRHHLGSMLKDNDTGPVLTIQVVTPCHVVFTVPRAFLLTLVERAKGSRLNVTIHPPGETPKTGTLLLADDTVQSGGDTIELRATFPNKDLQLWPGQFVEVTLPDD